MNALRPFGHWSCADSAWWILRCMTALVGCLSLETRWLRREGSGLGVVDATYVGRADFVVVAVWERVLLAGG